MKRSLLHLARIYAAALCGLLLAGPAAPVPPEALEQLDRLVRATMAEARLPSLSVAVGRDGELVYVSAAGFAELENALAATPRTVYPIGSVTKTLTAVAALQLAERGRLDLDAPFQEYCPAFPAKEHPVRVRQLLGHLGGIRGYDYGRFEEDFLNRRLYPSIEAALEKFREDPLIAPPGARYEYSSYGYVLVGCAIEGASGLPYMEYLVANVLGPAGMGQATLDDPERIIPFRVGGYGRGKDGEWRRAGCFNPSDRYPAGGLVATPTDLVRFANALLEGRFLSEASRQAMWSLQQTSAGESTGSGLGWTCQSMGARSPMAGRRSADRPTSTSGPTTGWSSPSPPISPCGRKAGTTSRGDSPTSFRAMVPLRRSHPTPRHRLAVLGKAVER
jgi:CubicO group peptidase (beta-lactamase class C family)